MASKPIIGVTGSHHRWAPSWWCLALALRLAGAKPYRISVTNDGDDMSLDGLVVSGGNDIGPELYGGADMPRAVIDRGRDQLEIRWIDRALSEGIPVLGICRGAQLLNVVLGGSLIQDVRQLRQRTSNRPSLLPVKRVRTAARSVLADICGPSLKVNSLHHQAIDSTGEGLRVVARDRDKLCQAIECQTRRAVLGVQWHPEYLFYLPSQFRLFRWFSGRARTGGAASSN